MNRRDFLRSSALLAGASALPGLLSAKDDAPFGGFTVGAQSYTFRKFSLEECLKRLRKLNLHYAEFYQGHIAANQSDDQIKATLKLCKEYGVTPVCYGVQSFSKNHDANKKLFDFGAKLGIKSFSANPDPDSFDSLDKLVAEHKIAIAIHPHGPVGGKNKDRWYSAEIILKAVKDHHELIGACLDTGHLIRMAQLGEPLDPVAQAKVMGARNFGFHLKDHDNKRKTDVIFGKDGGVLDVAALLKTLKELKFKGHLSIEYEAKENEPTEDVAACLAVVEEAAKTLA